MTTEAKIEANRNNALKSTGPKTSTGKTLVSRNALRHGLLSREALLSDEDRSVFRALASNLREDLEPVGTLEEILVDRVVAAVWRLRRVHTIETGLLYEGDWLSGPRSLWGDSCLKLSRYEAAIERGLFRALHELERLQTRRSGGSVPPPLALDVEVAVRESDGCTSG